MKVKTTAKGNFKVVLSATEAARLRSILIESGDLLRDDDISQETCTLGQEISSALCDQRVSVLF
jgi:hypothetical protein